ncbi:tetratricopeptide repeat protein [Paenibacillus albiflavus]|uniref:Tetratricopeptide repeat protein n=1 Tax=Paenibacillus albiflavus TaxID=2545760 RepID=A0A4R4EDM6_9BACL|nr:SAM-dependent methyltransferase [Paenibacillus albiflavus]TCZ77829.1 tetratricopeptide repeat protein [Paenibacillus albiflavus]
MVENKQQRFRFSEAPIWDLQRTYYEEEGMKAWKNDQVPQYITSNPMIATAYAEMIFGFLQDLSHKGDISEPVTILELGAGAGRFAFHVLHKLCELRDYAGIVLPPFRYVMTDLALKNIAGWQQHPALQSFIQQGMLDFAVFDAVSDTELNLVVARTTIREGDLKQPLVIIANYFFDSIPQELIYVGDGRIFECDVVIEFPENFNRLKPSEALKNMTLNYEHRPAPEYEEAVYPYRDVIALYQKELEDSHILFPVVGLKLLERLNQLSQSGLLLITADKGDHRLENWEFAEPPELIHHGSFSVTANYHAIQYVLEQRGALSHFPTSRHYKDLNVGCILMLELPMSYSNTRLAYRRFIERFGPDDFFGMKQWVDQQIETMGLQQILAFWRLGGYDAEFFIQSAQRISSLLPDASDEEILDIQSGIHIMWSSYYVMEQRYDLALDAGLLLFEMNMYEDAMQFLKQSVDEDEDEAVPTVLYCLAICSYELGLEEAALAYIREALVLEPGHKEALALLKCFE